MIGFLTVATRIATVLNATTAWTDVVGVNTYRGRVAPPDITGPFGRFYMEAHAYDGTDGQLAGSEQLSGERMRWTIVVDMEGTSNSPIVPAYEAQLAAFAGRVETLPDGTLLTFQAQGMVPLTEYTEGARLYQRLGTTYSVTVTHG